MRLKAHNLLKKIISQTAFIVLAQISFAQNLPRYNVIFISLDDMNDKCSILDFPAVLTPNLQRLASHGMLFKNAYANYALCNPSRTSILSGYRPDRTKIFENDQDPRASIGWGVRLLPEYFHDYGYHTERYAKIMHVTFENECQWDYAYDWPASAGSEFMKTHDNEEKDASTQNSITWYIGQTPEEQTQNGTVSRKIDSTLRKQTGQPFFIACGLSVHMPFTPTLGYWNMYGNPGVQELLKIDAQGNTSNIKGNGSGNIALPQTPANDKDDIPWIAFTQNVVNQSDDDWRRAVHSYYSEATEMDKQLGTIVDAIDSLNLWQNTVIVFWSDHGQHLGEHQGQWLKLTLFNESLHVPFIICAPGLQPGICTRLVENVDMYPTLLDLCNLPVRSDLEGSSLKPLLYHPDFAWKKAVFQQVQRRTMNDTTMGRSIYTEQFHYNSWEDKGEELYDRLNDPFEYTNLFYNAAYTDTLNSMRNILAGNWMNALPPQYSFHYYYRDADGDGYGDIQDSAGEYLMPAGYVTNNQDCNDSNAAVHTGATEINDSIDNNCNGEIDEGFTARTYYHDADNDGYGNTNDTIIALTKPNGYAVDSDDCNDNNAAINPGAADICDGIDNNCNGIIDENKLSAAITPANTYGACVNDLVTLTANYLEGVSYQWYKNNVVINGATSQLYQTTGSGSFQVKESNSYGCTSLSAATKITRYTKPSAKITPNGNLNICVSGSVKLTANSGAGYTYQWNKNNKIISGAVSRSYTATTIGNYSVTVTSGAVCSNTSSSVTVYSSCKPTRVPDPGNAISAKAQALSVYPNPGNGKFSVSYNAKASGIININIYDAAGQIIFSKKESALKGLNNYHIEVPEISTGTFFLELKNAGQSLRVKLVVEK